MFLQHFLYNNRKRAFLVIVKQFLGYKSLFQFVNLIFCLLKQMYRCNLKTRKNVKRNFFFCKLEWNCIIRKYTLQTGISHLIFLMIFFHAMKYYISYALLNAKSINQKKNTHKTLFYVYYSRYLINYLRIRNNNENNNF